MNALLAALRISRRGIGRARARSALIVVMIGLPILATTAMLTLSATREMSPWERLTMDLGAADARLADTGVPVPVRQNLTGASWEPVGKRRQDLQGRARILTQAEVQALAGAGGRIVPLTRFYGEYWTGDAYNEVPVWEADPRDPMTNGMFPLVRGRYPQAADEVLVTVPMKTAVGTTIRYTRGDVPKRVVGTVVGQQAVLGETIIGLPGSLLSASARRSAERFWLLDAPAPVTWKETLRFNRGGMAVLSRAVLNDPPSSAERGRTMLDGLYDPDAVRTDVNGILTTVLGMTLAVIEVVLLAGPAFAVGIRRRRRELALISAQGGSARHLKLVVLADGLTLGLAAAVLGVALGVGVARGIVSYVGVWPAGELGPFEVPAGQVALVAALGVVSGVVAAVAPAVQAARTNVVAALAGRRAEVRDRAGWPLLGLVLLVAGIAAMVYGIWGSGVMMFLGGVLGLLGLVMTTPWLVRRIGGLAGGLPLPLRLVVRDASRNRGRTAPAVVAVLAAAAAFSTVAVGVASAYRMDEESYRRSYPVGVTAVYGGDVTDDSWGRIRPILEAKLPGVPLVEGYHAVNAEGRNVDFQVLGDSCSHCVISTGPLGVLPAGGPDLLRLLLGRTDAAAEAALAEGRAVIFNPKAVENGETRLSVWARTMEQQEERTVTFPATVVTFQGPSPVLGVVPPAALGKVGFTARLGHLIVAPKDALPTPQMQRLIDGPVRAVTPNVAIRYEREVPQSRWNRDFPIWIMAALAGLVVFGCTFAVTGLAAADARPDLDALSAVGARPGTRRLVVAGQALFIAGFGVPAGLLVGLVPGFAMAAQQTIGRSDVLAMGLNGIPYEKVGLVFSVPWPTLLAVGAGLPLVAGLVVMLFAGTRITPVRRMG
ncbi:FtsX-like permease family protein [Streptosporangium sp. NPDC051022]|uniref:FtsX-like permease family protein n=1 Tax=Streptosporangium sp. NPDC051022 TaxID=3155752 RepID=UPI00342F2306